MVLVKVVFMGGPETGGGVTPMLYTTLLPFGGAVHSMVTVELVVWFIKLVSLTLVGGPPIPVKYPESDEHGDIAHKMQFHRVALPP